MKFIGCQDLYLSWLGAQNLDTQFCMYGALCGDTMECESNQLCKIRILVPELPYRRSIKHLCPLEAQLQTLLFIITCMEL